MRPSASRAAQARRSAVLLADLSDWGVHLGTRSFTQVSTEMLLRDLRRTVPSALGYTIVLGEPPDHRRVAMTVSDARLSPDQVASTLSFDLPVDHRASAAATFYASQEAAFDQLAALLVASAGFGPDRVRVGGAPAEAVEPGVHGLVDRTRINYALGVLLARGLSFEESELFLERLAEQLGTLEAAADHLLAGDVG